MIGQTVGRCRVTEKLGAGDTVVVVGTYTGAHRTPGKSFTAPAAQAYEMQDGKVVKFRQFTDAQLIVGPMS